MLSERVSSELELRKDEIEEEVKRRVEEAKRIMEQTMVEELERRKRQQQDEEIRRQVRHNTVYICTCIYNKIYLIWLIC